jgi:hypothetical protein
MANFSSEDFGSENYAALTWGLPSALSLPAITQPTPSVASMNTCPGWYASDNGLVRRVSGFKRKNATDFRTYYLDLSPIQVIRAGDTIAASPNISILAAPNTISCGNETAVGNRVFFTLEGGTPNSIYALQVRTKLTSGTYITRVVRVIVDEYT